MDKKKLKEIQDDMVESAHKVWLAGLGAVSLAGREGGKLFEQLVTKGQEVEDQGHTPSDRARETAEEMRNVVDKYWQTFETRLDDQLASVISRAGIPTKDEIQELTVKVDELTRAVEKMRKAQSTKKTAGGAGKTSSGKGSTSGSKKRTTSS